MTGDPIIHHVELSLEDLRVIHDAVQSEMKHHQKSADRVIVQLRDEPATQARINALDKHRLGLMFTRDVLMKIATAKHDAIDREADIVRLRSKGAEDDG